MRITVGIFKPAGRGGPEGNQENIPGVVTPLICKQGPSFLKGCYGLGTLLKTLGVSEALCLQDEDYALSPRLQVN